jgi:ATP-binding protein involved in chromosome partitioning
MALNSETNFLGALPLQLDIRMDVDEGKPTVIKSPESKASQIYQEIARKTAATLSLQSETVGAFPNITIE